MIKFIFISKDNRFLSLMGDDFSTPLNNQLLSNGEKGIISKIELSDKMSHRDISNEIIKKNDDFYSPYSGILIFCDSEYYENFCKKFGLFFMIFCSPKSGGVPDNALKQRIEASISSALKKFFHMKRILFVENQILMRLPYRNFNNERLRNLYDNLKKIDVINIDNIASDIKMIKSLCYKKVPGVSPAKIFVDDDLNNFVFGHEYHSRQGTSKHDGHSILCDIASKYRFGYRLDEFRHFNVQKKTKKRISGSFFNCHDSKETLKDKTHLNMFTSDFMEY